MGVDQNKIDLKNISKGEVVQNILDNSEGFKMIIKNEISHYIYKNTKRNPIVIPVLISTDLDQIKKQNSL